MKMQNYNPKNLIKKIWKGGASHSNSYSILFILLIISVFAMIFYLKQNNIMDNKNLNSKPTFIFTDFEGFQNPGQQLACSTNSSFNPLTDQDIEFCTNLRLDKVFIVDCNISNYNGYPQDFIGEEDEEDCPGRRVTDIYKPNAVQPFNLQDRNNNNIHFDQLLNYRGDIGIDIFDQHGNNIRMDDIYLSAGVATECGYQWTVPIQGNCNFIFNINKY
jgi:hypothetical protein